MALTDDDEANLAVVMTAALLRPGLPVVNPFDCFGDHLRLALRAPASYQLLSWLESGPGAALPERGSPPREGRWVVCGYGRFGRELTADLRAEGLQVTVIEPRATGEEEEDMVTADGSEPGVLARVSLEGAVGFVAGTDNDTTNLSLVAAARHINPALFIAARQNRPAGAPLVAAMDVDALLVPTEVVAHQVYAQLSTPLLWRFLQELPGKGDAWAADLVDRLTHLCGPQLQALWKIRLTRDEAPALATWVAAGDARLGDLLRNPEDRDDPLHAIVLLVRRGAEAIAAPALDFVLAPGDELLLAGWAAARRALAVIAEVDAAREYVVTGRRVPTSWVWRKLRPEPAVQKELTRRPG